MAELIHRTLAWLGEDNILSVVLMLVVGFFVWGYRKPAFRSVAPTLMTSVGILGTFCGVFVALYEFNPSVGEMNRSIEALLGGMRTAFVTSLIGLSSSIAFRIFETRFPINAQAHDPLAVEQRNVLEKLDSIRLAIAGDGDSSMVTQLLRLRDENRDGFRKLDGLAETIRDSLLKNLNNLIEDMRNIIEKQLGESLRDLISSIEEALIKQFGSTFVKFNEATLALEKWQKEHRAQVEQLTVAFNSAADNLTIIAGKCQHIPVTMEKLEPILDTANRDVEALNRRVEAFAGMREQAEMSFPTIKRHLDDIGQQLSNSAQGFSTIDTTLRSVFQSAERETRRIAHSHLETVQDIGEHMSRTLREAQQASASEITDIVEKGIRLFNDQMTSEINRVATAWGSNLVSVAERCSNAIRAVDRRP